MEILKLKKAISEIKEKKKNQLEWLNRRMAMKRETDVEFEIVCH